MLSNTSVWSLIRPLSAGVLFTMHTFQHQENLEPRRHITSYWDIDICCWGVTTTVSFCFNPLFETKKRQLHDSNLTLNFHDWVPLWHELMKVFQFHPKVKYPSFFGSRVCSDWMPLASSEFFFQKAWLYLPQTRCNVLLRAQQLPCHLLDPFADMLPRFVKNKLYTNIRKMSLGVENQTISRDTVNSLTSSKRSHNPT